SSGADNVVPIKTLASVVADHLSTEKLQGLHRFSAIYPGIKKLAVARGVPCRKPDVGAVLQKLGHEWVKTDNAVHYRIKTPSEAARANGQLNGKAEQHFPDSGDTKSRASNPASSHKKTDGVASNTKRARDMFTPVEVRDWPSMSINSPHTNDIRNVKAVLHAAGVQLRYDVFTGKSVATFNGKNTIIDDGVCLQFWTMIQSSKLRATYSFACDAITALSRETTFDSATDFFSNLPKWDGITRAETLLIDELGAEDTPYTRGATRLFFASLVRRGMGRESKCDEFLILRGQQRLGKSSLFKFLISEELFQENLKMSHSTREVLELTLGKLVVEMAELSGMKKTDRDDAKNFFSRTYDEFSLKHEKHATRRARRFTFIGTANEEGPIANMLEEDRRFIIIPVKKRADLNRIKRDRLQILAEAIEIEKAYGPILELHDELRPEACKARAQVVARPEYEDALTETFGEIISAKITVSDVYAFLGLRDRTAIGRYTKSTGNGIKPIMERLG